MRNLVPAPPEPVVRWDRERDGRGVHQGEDTECHDDQRATDALGRPHDEGKRAEQFDPHAGTDNPRDASGVVVVERGEPLPIGVGEERVVDELDGPDHSGHEHRRSCVREQDAQVGKGHGPRRYVRLRLNRQCRDGAAT